MVRAEPELGRQGPQVSRSPSPPSLVGLWMAALRVATGSQGLSVRWRGSAQPPTKARLSPGDGAFPLSLVLGCCHVGLDLHGN